MDTALPSEVNKLKERLSKQHEQQCLLEQIVSNISSLVEGSGDPMCIFDKDGFFMHVNAACRKLLGISDQHSSQLNIFDFYTSWDRERVFKESVQRRATKWSGTVSFIKGGANEIRVFQAIELLHSSKNNLDGTFFKSYLTVQENSAQEKLQTYYEMIRHMPVGVALWKLEKTSCRLLCSNSLASQYVGVPLDLRKDIHETLPNGAEVFHFLEEVVKTQRVCTLEKFRGTPTGREVTVTAFPLVQDCVAVVLEPPKKDPLLASVESTGVGLAMVENQRLTQFNDHFVTLVGNQKDIIGKDVITLLEGHTSQESRTPLFDLRRAILESRVHHVEIETEQHQWKVCVHPFADSNKRCMVVAFRINLKAPPAVHRATFPILPHLREALPIAPSQPTTPAPTQVTPPPSTTTTATTSTSTTAAPQPSTSNGLDTMFRDLVENFPCGVAIVKAERVQDMMNFRLVDINRAARVFSDHLIVGKSFDEASPAPFDAAFVRVLSISAQTHERRVVSRLNLYGSYLVLAARTIPLRDSYVGIAFEEASVMVPQTYNQQGPGKRSHSDLENVHLVLPNRKPSCVTHKQEEASPQTPAAPSSSTPSSQSTTVPSSTKVLHEQIRSSAETIQPLIPEHPFSPRHHTLPDMGSLLNNTLNTPLPKPILPSLSAHASLAGILSPTSREKTESPLVQQCVIGIVYCDVQGKLLVVNRSFCQMLGYTEYELIDLPIMSICGEDADVVQSVLRQLACGDATSFDVPLRFHNKRAHPVWTLTTFSLNRTAGERPSVLLQVQQAVRLERFPEVLFADREVLRIAFNELALSSVVMEVGAGSALRISSANHAFCDVIGSNEEELRGRPMTDVIYPDDRDKTAKVVHEILAGRIPCHQLSIRIHSRVGPIWAFLSLSVVHDSKSKPMVLVAQLQPMDKVS